MTTEDEGDVDVDMDSSGEKVEVIPEIGDLMCHTDEDEEDMEMEPFCGWSKEEEDKLYEVVETKSLSLFDQVISLEKEHTKLVGEYLSLISSPALIPKESLPNSGGSEIYIEKIVSEDQTWITGVGKLPKDQRPQPTHYPNACPFSPNELMLLRRPLALGWIRDVVVKSIDGIGAGEVSYISPDGTVVRSYKDLALALSKIRDGKISRVNFSFTARPIGGSKNEVVRTPQDNAKIGRLVNQAVMDIKKKTGNVMMNGGTNVRKRRRGGQTQLPPRNTLMEKMKANDSEGGLFGISAISEIFAGMEKADAERELEEYSQMMNLMAAEEELDPYGNGYDVGGGARVLDDGEMVPPRDEILPCSIRCPQMTGNIPELQCKRCLCLYHAECLGIIETPDATDFLCSNCEGTQSPIPSSDGSPDKMDSVYELMNRMLDLKKPRTFSPPQPFPTFGRGLSITKVEPSLGLKKNQIKIPTLTSHNTNLTITPLTNRGRNNIPKLPPIPTLKGPRIPIYKKGKGGSTLIDSIQLNPSRGGNYSKHPFSPLNSNRKPLIYPVPNFGGSFGTSKPVSGNLFRNYPQSVVSIGPQKFIVIPHIPEEKEVKIFQNKPVKKPVHAFGRDKTVLKEIFQYLTVKDLLNAVSVNLVWKQQTEDNNLWTILRLKNTTIYDVESFGAFVSSRGTRVIDFRKMLGNVDWAVLFHTLNSNAPELRELVVGSKMEELLEIAKENCPRLTLLETLP